MPKTELAPKDATGSDMDLMRLADDEVRARLKQMDTETLKTQFAQGMIITARQIQVLAAVWMELSERGEDLGQLKSGLAAYLPQVAGGTLAPDFLVRYAGQKMLLGYAAKMPLEDQKKMAETGTVVVVEPDAEGKPVERQVPLHQISSRDLHRVFSEQGLRPIVQQYKMVSSAQNGTKSVARATKATVPRKARKIEVVGDVVVVGNAAAGLDRLVSVLSQHYGVDLATVISAAK